MVCSSSACCCSRLAWECSRLRLCSSSSSLATRSSSCCVCSSSLWRWVSSSSSTSCALSSAARSAMPIGSAHCSSSAISRPRAGETPARPSSITPITTPSAVIGPSRRWCTVVRPSGVSISSGLSLSSSRRARPSRMISPHWPACAGRVSGSCEGSAAPPTSTSRSPCRRYMAPTSALSCAHSARMAESANSRGVGSPCRLVPTTFSPACSHSASAASRRAPMAFITVSAIIRKATPPMLRLTKENAELLLDGATL
ncbi:hypothetical protein D3C71_1325050 [compost metagenome]